MTMPLTEPTFVKQTEVIFRYPYATLATEITLPCPALGDIERYSQQKITRESRGGTLIVFRDASWIEDNELALTFTNLTKDQRDSIEDMVAATLGIEIQYTDHFGQIWKAIVTSPDTLYVQDAHDSCADGRYTVNLVLNVELVSWP